MLEDTNSLDGAQVILNQTLYNVYLFKYNSHFYHDMQVVSFDKVKGMNKINYM